jgi:predicted nuclease with TOPRIM domain
MMQKFKIITVLVFVSTIFCGIMILQASAEESSAQRPAAERNAAIRTEIENLRKSADQAQTEGRNDEAEQMRAEAVNLAEQLRIENQQKQLNQLDQDVERLRHITQEAEEIRSRIAQQTGQPSAPAIQAQPQRLGRGQLPPAAGARRGARGQRQNLPVIPRPGLQMVVDNIPQMIDQLRNAFDNNIERVQNAYERIRGRLEDMQTENQRMRNENERLRDENQRLRDENQKLRDRLQEQEPRRPRAGEGQTDTFEQP